MTELLIKNIISEILFENRICESEENQYVVNFLYDNLLCEKLLYGENVDIVELRNILRKKIVNFEFIKLDGTIRNAVGTLLMKYVPQRQHPKGIRPSSPTVATFYDLQKKDWRSVSQDSKEIVLKKDDMSGKPVVMVKDKPEGKEVPAAQQKELNIGDVFNFTKATEIKYKSGEKKRHYLPTFITITRETNEGFWGKTAGSEIDILLTPERMQRLGNPLEIGDEYEFAKLDKNGNKIFTTIKITRKSNEGFWGKTKGSDNEILLTNERLKRLHRYEQPEITVNGKPMEEPVEEPEVGEPEKPEISKVKPIAKTEKVKTYHFKNLVTHVTETSELTPKDVIKKLRELGPDWFLETPQEHESKEKDAEMLNKEELPKISKEEPEEETHKIKSKPIIKDKDDLENIEAQNL